MTAIPRYRRQRGRAILSAGFRPFFLLAGIWAAIAIPVWLAVLAGDAAIPNWTGRMPLQGGPLAFLVLLWATERAAVLFLTRIAVPGPAVLDLAFPVAFLAVVAREIMRYRTWR